MKCIEVTVKTVMTSDKGSYKELINVERIARVAQIDKGTIITLVDSGYCMATNSYDEVKQMIVLANLDKAADHVVDPHELKAAP